MIPLQYRRNAKKQLVGLTSRWIMMNSDESWWIFLFSFRLPLFWSLDQPLWHSRSWTAAAAIATISVIPATGLTARWTGWTGWTGLTGTAILAKEVPQTCLLLGFLHNFLIILILLARQCYRLSSGDFSVFSFYGIFVGLFRSTERSPGMNHEVLHCGLDLNFRRNSQEEPNDRWNSVYLLLGPLSMAFQTVAKSQIFRWFCGAPKKKWKNHTDFTKKLRNHKKNGKTTKFTLW